MGSLCDIRHFDMRYLTVQGGGFFMQLFPLNFQNKSYCFFNIGESFFPGLALADRSGNLHALDRETTFFLGFEHNRIFHRYYIIPEDYTFFLLKAGF